MKNRSVWKSPPNDVSTPVSSFQPSPSVTSSEPDPAMQLSEVLVTASRSEKKLEDIARSVSVISADDIKKSGANSLAEVLSQVEGIYISASQQNFGSNQSLFVRGANSNQSMVMMDGIKISDPSTPTGSIDFSEISLSDIERIEIVRGSHSTLYGSSAIGAVINIITNKKMKQGLNLDVQGTAGVFGEGTSLVYDNFILNYTFQKGQYLNLNMANTAVSGLNATIDTSSSSEIPIDKDDCSRLDVGVKAGVKNNKWDMFVSHKVAETNADIDDAEFNDDDNYILNFERKFYSYSITHKIDSAFSVSLNGSVSEMVRNRINDSSIVDASGNYDGSYFESTYRGASSTNELQIQFSKKNYSMIFGGGGYNETMNQKFYSYSYLGPHSGDLDTLHLSSRTNSFFLLADVKGSMFSEKLKPLSFSFGGRSNNNNTFNNSSTFHFSPHLKLKQNASLYANFSSGYNAPSLFQLHAPDEDFNSNISLGNINLRPETSVTSEFGIYQKLDNSSSVRIGYFKTIVNDVIEYVDLYDGTVPIALLTGVDFKGATYLNLETLTSEGMELSVQGSLSEKIYLSGNFSCLRGKQHFSYEDIDTAKTKNHHIQLVSNGKFLTSDVHTTGLTRRPSSANVSIIYKPVEKLFLKSMIRYTSERNDVQFDYSNWGPVKVSPSSSASFALVDIIAGLKLNANFSGLLRIENVFNTSYTEIRGYTSRGRGVFVSVNYTM